MPGIRGRLGSSLTARTRLMLALLIGALLAIPALAIASPAPADDTQKPVITAFDIFARGTRDQKYTNSVRVNFTLTATDDTRVRAYFLCDGCKEPPVPGSLAWETTKPRFAQIYSNGGAHTVHAWVEDAALNISQPKTDTIFLDNLKPAPSILRPASRSTMKALTSIGGTVGESSIGTTPVPSSGLASGEYAILRRSDCSWWNPKTQKMVKGTCGDEKWQDLGTTTTSKTFNKSIGKLAEKGKYQLYVRFIDRAGNVGIRFIVFFIQ